MGARRGRRVGAAPPRGAQRAGRAGRAGGRAGGGSRGRGDLGHSLKTKRPPELSCSGGLRPGACCGHPCPAAASVAPLLISPPGTGLPRIAATGACALALSVLVLLVFDRIPVWGFQALLAAGTLLVDWAVYASGDQTSPYAMFYFWIAIYSFYFLS